jgi:hypothetical protein
MEKGREIWHRIILRWIFRKWKGLGTDWIDLAQDRNRYRAVVNTVMNFRFP